MSESNSEFSKEERIFRNKICVVLWVTLILPPVTGIFMLSFVGVFPFPQVLYPFTDYAAIVVIIFSVSGIKTTRYFINKTVHNSRLKSFPDNYLKNLARLPLYYFGVLFLYFALGLVSTLYSLSTIYGYNYPVDKYFTSILGVIPGGLITALPIFFYLTDTLGAYLAPQGLRMSVAPIKLKLIVLGLFVPVLIDTLLIMYYQHRTGYFELETIGIWFFLIVIAAVGTIMAWRSFKQSLSPFSNAIEFDNKDHTHMKIIPNSLDELGILSERWSGLWERVLDYERGLSENNIDLRTGITEKDKELEKERTFINKVLDKANALIIVLDRNACIVRYNPAFETMTGFILADVYGKPIWDWLLPYDQKENVREVFTNLIIDGVDSQYENRIMRANGDSLLVNWNNSTIKSDKNEVEYVISVGIDVTDSYEAKLKLLAAVEAAESASKAKSEFLSSMSHELRTPMNAILGFAQVLQLDKKLSEDHKESVDEILRAGSHLMNLINEVLDLSRIESGKLKIDLEVTNLVPIIFESVQLLMPQAEKYNIKLINKLFEDGIWISKVDIVRFKQIMINLLSNAIKYNRENGKVIIDIEKHSDTRLRISIADTGKGIPAVMHENIFQPFERLGFNKSAVEGTGIGLAISREMIETMNGTISLTSELDEGSIFYIELPLIKNVIN